MGDAAQDELQKLLEDWRAKAWPYPGVGLKGKGDRRVRPPLSSTAQVVLRLEAKASGGQPQHCQAEAEEPLTRP